MSTLVNFFTKVRITTVFVCLLALCLSKAYSGIKVCDQHTKPVPYMESSVCQECSPEDQVLQDEDNAQFRTGWNKASYSFFDSLVRDKPENRVLSPHSIMGMLSMLAAGADGKTQSSITEIMGTNPESFQKFTRFYKREQVSSEVTVRDFNHISTSKEHGIQHNYRLFLRHHIDENVNIKEGVDFLDPSAVQRLTDDINNKVCAVTEGMITECLTPENLQSQNPAVTLVNATYFSALWQDEFNRVPGQFTLLNGKEMQASMFSNINHYIYSQYDGWTSVSIPYSGEYEMIVMLPPADNSPRDITQDVFKTLQDPNKHCVMRRLHLKVPEYLFSSDFDATCLLGSQEQGNPTTEDADFSAMIMGTMAHVSKIIHKVTIKTNKDGSEAAAITTGEIEPCCSDYTPPPIIPVSIDRPFLFIIRDDRHCAIRFIGQVYFPDKYREEDEGTEGAEGAEKSEGGNDHSAKQCTLL